MMKKQSTFFLSILLCAMCSVCAFAAEKPYIVDDADLLTGAEENALEATAKQLHDTYAMDFVVLTTESCGDETPVEYADNYYIEHNYGEGSDKDGVLLLVSMENRDWYVSTSGYGITAFTDFGIDQLGDNLISYLGSGDYNGAFRQYFDTCDIYMTKALDGTPFDSNMASSPLQRVLITLILSLLIASVVIAILTHDMRKIRPQRTAQHYVDDGSFQLTKQRDLFLYSTQTRVPRQDHKSSGGGSSTHTASNGSKHGGGGGKF